MPFAVIGAAAMAAHGVSRSTGDLDLLTVSAECLAHDFWAGLVDRGVQVDVRFGDANDPLRGVVRFAARGSSPIDLVVGKSAWQSRILEDACDVDIEGVSVPVASRVDLILLKLFAGGPQDAWDIAQLLDGPDRDVLSGEVERSLDALPSSCRDIWSRLHTGRS